MEKVDMSPSAVMKRIHEVFELEVFYRNFLSKFKPIEKNTDQAISVQESSPEYKKPVPNESNKTNEIGSD
ncbi:MAG: hypothetical protein ACFCU1_04935 [Sumerlaeia bacterium]